MSEIGDILSFFTLRKVDGIKESEGIIVIKDWLQFKASALAHSSCVYIYRERERERKLWHSLSINSQG